MQLPQSRGEDLKVSHGKLWRSGRHHSQPLSSVSIISEPPPVKTSAHPLRLCKKEECSTKQRANDTETIKSIVWFFIFFFSVRREGRAGEVTPFSENGVRELLLSWWLLAQVWQGGTYWAQRSPSVSLYLMTLRKGITWISPWFMRAYGETESGGIVSCGIWCC